MQDPVDIGVPVQGPGAATVDELRRRGLRRGDLLALALAPGVGMGLATTAGHAPLALPSADPAEVAHVIALIEVELRPRWVLWSKATATVLVERGVRLAACWDVAAVHRLLVGGWRAEPGEVWAHLQGLDPDTLPRSGPLDLFSFDSSEHRAPGERDEPSDPGGHDGPGEEDHRPVRRDGHLDPEWAAGAWSESPTTLARWAAVAARAAELQRVCLSELAARPAALLTARSESAAELLCAELALDGLPLDRAAAEAVIARFVGARPRDEAEATAVRDRRDDAVLRHVPAATGVDLRSPGQVRGLLRHIGVEVPDTRAWRLEALRDAHPLIDALLVWRKAERMSTTFGYDWLDEHLGEDGRLRGVWSGSDGAAGRMTASAGLHNMPADLREAVVAEAGHVFVRADLGQIEPRVLAVVAGDRALARAALEDDLYTPVAQQLGVDRATAKVAVLGAMYGQTTGRGAEVLGRLRQAYPVAMAHLEDADRAGQAGRDLRTYGGRLIRMGPRSERDLTEHEARRRAAARGRYGRNALVQGAAAELFKMWAATVRARAAPHGGRIVLCLHDELLVQAPAEQGDVVARVLADGLQEAAHRWAPGDHVRFVVDISTVRRWSDAKV